MKFGPKAWFAGRAYEKHRHDSYAIGLTDSGVQSFSYRGASQVSTPGKVIVLHPDEAHDGQAGSAEGFGYRMLYIEPARIIEALRSLLETPPTLPFVPEAVSTNPTLSRAIETAFHDSLALPEEPLAIDSLVLRLAEGLADGDPSFPHASEPRHLDRDALDQVCQRLSDEQASIVRSRELEAMTGLSRYELARQFRALYGTSPYRYLLMRRLGSARNELARNRSLADLAVATGFSDQAHFTRSSNPPSASRRGVTGLCYDGRPPRRMTDSRSLPARALFTDRT